METIHSVRIDHGSVQSNTMAYPQRQTPNHRYGNQVSIAVNNYSPISRASPIRMPAADDLRQSHSGGTQNELYKPSRSPYNPYPASSPQQQRYSASHQQQQQQAAAFSASYREYRPPRISLLHPTEFPPQLRPQQVGEQPFKKIRLQDHKDITPLRIDTREQPGAYNPQVEAISPTLPDHVQQEEAFKTTKDELLQQIGKVDREIAKAESKISILKKRQQELEEIASKPVVKQEVEEVTQPKHQSLAQKIYADNRKKAQMAHSKLDSIGPKVDWPIYNQPSDAPVYQENKRRHLTFKKRLLEYFKKRHAEKEQRESYLTETYSKLMQEWLRKVDKIESSQKRKAKEAKNREFFEKVFPELRKQREDKERFNRVGARIKSEADLEEIMDNLQEQALEDKKMRSYAVIPPILLDARQRKVTYMNNNGHVVDMAAEHKSREFINVWTPTEHEIFKEKYLQHPKNFGVVASYLERKSVQDCVQHYYLTKKTENYKQLLRKSRQRTRSSRNNPQKVNSTANTSVVDILTTGVTTRLQREQQQKTVAVVQQQQQQREQQQQQEPSGPGSGNVPMSSSNSSSSTNTLTTIINVTSSTSGSSTPGQCGGASVSTLATSSGASTATTSSNPTVLTCGAAANAASLSSAGCGEDLKVSASSNCGSGSGAQLSQGLLQPPPSSQGVKSVVTSNSIITSSAGSVISSVTGVNSSSALSSSSGGVLVVNSSGGACGMDAGSPAGGVTNAGVPGAPGATGVPVHTIQTNTSSEHSDIVLENSLNSDQPSTPSIAVTENKKKKERRKDKENVAMETSDDEAPDIQDKAVQGQCIICRSALGPQLHSRPLAPNQGPQYGLREDQVPPGGRVCNTCRCKCVRSRFTHCPLPSCPNSRGRVKRLRSFPQRLQDLPADIREPLLAEFHVPSGVTKCCSACFNRIQRRLGPQEEWPEEEINQLRTALTDIGALWQAVGERLGKPPQQVRAFYAANRKKLNLEVCLGDRKPTLTDEEESGSSTSSCEEPMRDRHSSDTASAESPPVAQDQPQGPAKKEDYDSSATETADEGQTPDHYQSSATITVVNSDGQPRPANNSPMTVKDLMLNVIELQLMKNPGATAQHPPTSGTTPTISSILNTDSPEVTIVREYSLGNQNNDLSLAKLVTPLIGATITPVPAPVSSEPPQRDDLVVLQVQDGRESEPLTLDLSIKKPREPAPPPAHAKHQMPLHRTSEPYIATYHQERKSPAVYVSAVPRLPSKQLSPKPSNPKTGSITLGTPISISPRYEGLLRQMPPEPKMGSITQGTPIHMPPHMQEKRIYDYYNKRQPQPPPPPVGPQQGGNYPGQYRQPWPVEQQQLQRQIIMNDYITSQQMHGARRQEKPQQANYYATSSPHRTPPPQQQPQRQGVIQRHTRPHYPPGHEALSSLVDVAVQQPSLPVPAPHEGLGKTIADHLSEQPHRFQLMHQQQQQQMRQQQQRLDSERRAYHQQQQQQAAARHQQQARSDSSTLTAASLIDAIITHQINQTEGGRDVVQNNREPPRPSDRLFQGFHRDPPVSTMSAMPENNGERSPSVISVDLESDTTTKSLTVKELADSVINLDFNSRQSAAAGYYHHQENVQEQWKRRLHQQQQVQQAQQQQQQHQQQHQQQQQAQQQREQHQQREQQAQQQREQHQKEESHRDLKPRSATPQTPDERQIIRIAQPPQKYVEPVSPPENNHWQDQQNFRRYPQPQQPHISALDYVKNRIVEVMRTEDDKKEPMSINPMGVHAGNQGDKERSDSPGDMVIDEDKHESEFGQQSGFAYPYGSMHAQSGGPGQKDQPGGEGPPRSVEPKPLLSAQYEPLSDED